MRTACRELVTAKLTRTPFKLGSTHEISPVFTHSVGRRPIFHLGVWEPDVSHVIQDNLSPGDVFVDIGANVATIHCLDRGVLDQRAGLSRLKLRRAILCCFSEIYLL